MRRVRILYKDGTAAYGLVDTTGAQPKIIISGNPYDLSKFAKTGAVIAVNDQETLELMLEHGVNARPTDKQIKITINVTQDFDDRVHEAAKEDGQFVTTLVVQAVEECLAKRARKKKD